MKIIAEVWKHGNIAPRHTNVSKGSDVNLTDQITQLYFDYFEKPQGVMLCPKTKAQFQSGPCTLTWGDLKSSNTQTALLQAY